MDRERILAAAKWKALKKSTADVELAEIRAALKALREADHA